MADIIQTRTLDPNTIGFGFVKNCPNLCMSYNYKRCIGSIHCLVSARQHTTNQDRTKYSLGDVLNNTPQPDVNGWPERLNGAIKNTNIEEINLLHKKYVAQGVLADVISSSPNEQNCAERDDQHVAPNGTTGLRNGALPKEQFKAPLRDMILSPKM